MRTSAIEPFSPTRPPQAAAGAASGDPAAVTRAAGATSRARSRRRRGRVRIGFLRGGWARAIVRSSDDHRSTRGSRLPVSDGAGPATGVRPQVRSDLLAHTGSPLTAPVCTSRSEATCSRTPVRGHGGPRRLRGAHGAVDPQTRQDSWNTVGAHAPTRGARRPGIRQDAHDRTDRKARAVDATSKRPGSGPGACSPIVRRGGPGRGHRRRRLARRRPVASARCRARGRRAAAPGVRFCCARASRCSPPGWPMPPVPAWSRSRRRGSRAGSSSSPIRRPSAAPRWPSRCEATNVGYEAVAHGAAAAALAPRLAGERVAVTGRLAPPPEAAPWLVRRRIVGRLTIDRVVDEADGSLLVRLANGYRRALADGASALPQRSRSLLFGVCSGRRPRPAGRARRRLPGRRAHPCARRQRLERGLRPGPGGSGAAPPAMVAPGHRRRSR